MYSTRIDIFIEITVTSMTRFCTQLKILERDYLAITGHIDYFKSIPIDIDYDFEYIQLSKP